MLLDEARILALHTISATERVLTADQNRALGESDYPEQERLRHLVYDLGSVLAEANHALEALEQEAGL